MIHIQKVILATGLEMFENNYFGENSDDTWTMWIKWNWNPSTKIEHWAPIVEVFKEQQKESTHKITGEEVYFKLNQDENESEFYFESFIEKFVSIERLKK